LIALLACLLISSAFAFIIGGPFLAVIVGIILVRSICIVILAMVVILVPVVIYWKLQLPIRRSGVVEAICKDKSYAWIVPDSKQGMGNCKISIPENMALSVGDRVKFDKVGLLGENMFRIIH